MKKILNQLIRNIVRFIVMMILIYLFFSVISVYQLIYYNLHDVLKILLFCLILLFGLLNAIGEQIND